LPALDAVEVGGPEAPQEHVGQRPAVQVKWAAEGKVGHGDALAHVEDAQAARTRRDSGFEQLVLRVQDQQPASSFDIPIQWSDSSWYIYLPNQDADYVLELGYLASGRFRLLARSGYDPVRIEG
jgi:hypothetical protein